MEIYVLPFDRAKKNNLFNEETLSQALLYNNFMISKCVGKEFRMLVHDKFEYILLLYEVSGTSTAG